LLTGFKTGDITDCLSENFELRLDQMDKLLLYKILFIANIIISILIVIFIVAFHPFGKNLYLLIIMAVLGCMGAMALYKEIRKLK
jgi:hypothetical protein